MTLRIGLILAALLALSDLFSFALGPLPVEVVVAATALGVITLAALVPAWRGGRTALRVVAVSRIVSALLAVPAFFADDVPAGVQAGAAIAILLAAASVALLFRAMTAQSVQHLT